MLMLKLGSLLQVAFVGISRERYTSSCASAVDEKDFELFLKKGTPNYFVFGNIFHRLYRPRCKPVIFSKVIQFLTKEVL